MTNRVIEMTSRKDIESELQITDYVLQISDEQQRSDFENQLVDNKSLQYKVNEEIKLSNKIKQAFPTRQISDDAYKKFSQTIEKEFTDNSRSNRFYKITALSAVAASLLMAIILFMPTSTPAINEFETLSTDDSKLVMNQDGFLYTIIFAEKLTKIEQASLANSLGFKITSYKSGAESVVIKVNQKLSDTELLRWRALPKIVFLETTITIKK